jgi:obscurin-like protein 1
MQLHDIRILNTACTYFSIPAAVVKFSPMSESDSNKRVETGDPVVLYCEVSHPSASVGWFKDGVELQVTDSLNIQSEGNMRRIVIRSAEFTDSGVYTCETMGDVIKFNVEVEGELLYVMFGCHGDH